VSAAWSPPPGKTRSASPGSRSRTAAAWSRSTSRRHSGAERRAHRALDVSRALTPLRALVEPGRTAEGETAAICASVSPAQLSELVFALVPEDGTVYVRSLWHKLDTVDQKAFAIWASECFGVARLVDAERGVELAAPAQPASAP